MMHISHPEFVAAVSNAGGLGIMASAMWDSQDKFRGAVRLTKALTRRAFMDGARDAFSLAQRHHHPISVMMIDVDHFKQFNDTHGHACGDHVLTRVAGMLRERVRDVDRIARWGGEEFILLLPETDAEGAATLAGKLCQAVSDNVFEYGGQRLAITLTLGVAAYRKGDSLDACIARADSALYRGKEDGRNTVAVNDTGGLSLVN